MAVAVEGVDMFLGSCRRARPGVETLPARGSSEYLQQPRRVKAGS